MPTRDVLLVTASIVQALEALLLAIVLASLYHTYRRAYQATWALSWLAGTTWILCTQLTLALGPSLPVDHPMRLLASFTAVAGGYLQIALLVVGTLELIERQDSPLAQHRRLLFWSCVALAAAAVITTSSASGYEERFLVRFGLRRFIGGVSYIFVGLLVLRHVRAPTTGSRIVGITFMLFALHELEYGALSLEQYLSGVEPGVMPLLPYVDILLQTLLGVGLVTWMLEDERRLTLAAVERERAAEQERQQIELQLQHTQRLDSLGMLAGGVAHDFNNLLQVVLGNTNLALDELPEDEPVRQRLEQIETAVTSAAELTRQMLAYAGQGPRLTQVLDLSAEANQIGALLSSVLSKKVHLEFECAEELPSISGDPSQIRQVLMNLVTNAAESLENRPGRVTVTTGCAVLEPSEPNLVVGTQTLEGGPYVFVGVSDTGSGMTAETRARMFEPFFSTKFPGRGLGLASVLGIVRSHSGAIRVDTAVGSGTTVTVYFPAAVDAAAPEHPHEPLAAPLPGAVLVVDDEPPVRALAETTLRRAGYATTGASDGLEAIEKLTAHRGRFDVIVLDLAMPRLGGAEAFPKLRAICPGVPIVLLSGFAQDTVAHLLEEPAVFFLSKPCRPATLLNLVARAQRLAPRAVHRVPQGADRD